VQRLSADCRLMPVIYFPLALAIVTSSDMDFGVVSTGEEQP
jgi:hypothetical protein